MSNVTPPPKVPEAVRDVSGRIVNRKEFEGQMEVYLDWIERFPVEVNALVDDINK